MVYRGGVERKYDIPEVARLFVEHFGYVTQVSVALMCSETAIYDLLDIYPELVEARAAGRKRRSSKKVESAEAVLDKLLQRVDVDPTNAGRQAQYILSNLKESAYYRDQKPEEKHELAEEVTKYFRNTNKEKLNSDKAAVDAAE